MKAKYFRGLETDYKSLQFLTMQRKIPCLDAEHAIATEAAHVFHVHVPGDRRGVAFFKRHLFCDQVVNEDFGIFIHHGQFVFRGRQVQAPDGSTMFYLCKHTPKHQQKMLQSSDRKSSHSTYTLVQAAS
jgi:hypothetical protein